jgi:excisionase family DNA binding protein
LFWCFSGNPKNSLDFLHFPRIWELERCISSREATAMTDAEPLISLAEAGRRTGLPRGTLEYLVNRRRLRCFQIDGRVRKVRESDVRELIQEWAAIDAAPGKPAKVS